MDNNFFNRKGPQRRCIWALNYHKNNIQQETERLCLRLLKSSTDWDLQVIPNRIITLMRIGESMWMLQKARPTSFFFEGCGAGSWLLHGLFSSCVRGSYSLVVVASCWGGFSCWRAWALGMQAQQLQLLGLVAPWHVESSYSVQLSCVSLQPNGLQHARLPWPSPTPGVYSNSFMSIESVMPSYHLILCHPLLPPSIFPSIRVFSNELAPGIRWSKYWSFSFSISWDERTTKRSSLEGK